MEICIGLFIIAIGAFCQSSCYVPINKIKDWSWESYWLIQGIFAWCVLPILGAFLAVPEGHSLIELFHNGDSFKIWMACFFGFLWGIGGLTFGLSMRYLGVALGQSIALGTCAGLGTVLGPIILHCYYPEANHLSKLTAAVLIGVVVTLIGITVIGIAGSMKSKSLSEEEKKKAVKDFNLPKGLAIALLAGVMSGCFNVGLNFGDDAGLSFKETPEIFRGLPTIMIVTLGGFITNVIYCLYQNTKNKTWCDYAKKAVWGNNLIFCAIAGALWYSQFFGLSLAKGFFVNSPSMITYSFCILMALGVTFSQVWGIILKEWKGCSTKNIIVLTIGLIILIISSFLPQLIG